MKTQTTEFTLRPGSVDDAARCGEICYHAFASLAEHHKFVPDFPSVAAATEVLTPLLQRPDVYAVVAERAGTVVGSNFLWRLAPVAGIGPITVDPDAQAASVGRRLMDDVQARAAVEGFPAVRLVQATYNRGSMSLYTKLGFEVREPLTCMQGPPIDASVPGRDVRTAELSDVDACDRLCRRVHGHDRGHELREAVASGTARVVVRDRRIVGYATLIGFFGHAVAETDEDLWALIASAPSFEGPGFLLPARSSETFRRCLAHGLRVTQPMTLMTTGLYNEPRGAWLPSILF